MSRRRRAPRLGGRRVVAAGHWVGQRVRYGLGVRISSAGVPALRALDRELDRRRVEEVGGVPVSSSNARFALLLLSFAMLVEFGRQILGPVLEVLPKWGEDTLSTMGVDARRRCCPRSLWPRSGRPGRHPSRTGRGGRISSRSLAAERGGDLLDVVDLAGGHGDREVNGVLVRQGQALTVEPQERVRRGQRGPLVPVDERMVRREDWSRAAAFVHTSG